MRITLFSSSIVWFRRQLADKKKKKHAVSTRGVERVRRGVECKCEASPSIGPMRLMPERVIPKEV